MTQHRRHHATTRFILGLLAAVLLGALTTYAVATASVFMGRRSGSILEVTGNVVFKHQGREYWAQRFEAGSFTRIDVTPIRGISLVTHDPAPEYELLAPVVDDLDLAALGPPAQDQFHRPGLTVQFHSAGWPWPAVQAMTAHTWRGTNPELGSIAGGWAIFGESALIATSSRPSILPVRPLWPGFVKTTGLFATAWAAFATLGPLWVRRWARRRGGRCLGCGYQLGREPPQSVCPECGLHAE